jgi:hypothetical protein
MNAGNRRKLPSTGLKICHPISGNKISRYDNDLDIKHCKEFIDICFKNHNIDFEEFMYEEEGGVHYFVWNNFSIEINESRNDIHGAKDDTPGIIFKSFKENSPNMSLLLKYNSYSIALLIHVIIENELIG